MSTFKFFDEFKDQQKTSLPPTTWESYLWTQMEKLCTQKAGLMDRVQQKKPLSLTKEHGMVTAFQVKILNPQPRADSKYPPQKHILLASFFMISEFMPHNESKSQNMRPICIYTSVLLLVKIVAQHNFEQQRHLLDLFAICSAHCIR